MKRPQPRRPTRFVPDRHTSRARLIVFSNATAKAAGWKSRQSPHSGARRTGDFPSNGPRCVRCLP